MEKSKVILIDCSGLFVPTVKVVNRLRQQRAEKSTSEFILPPRAMYFNSLLSAMKKIGVDEDDTVIMALEGHSFRKDIYAPYKDHRAGLRKKDKFIDWDYEYNQVNELHDSLNEATNWHFLRVADGLEADDIIAISVRYFKDRECIIVTGDKDLHQLAHYKNVKIFNINKKCKGSKGVYELVSHPLKILSTKARKGDESDNIIPALDETKEDVELRYKLVNLLELPEDIEQKGIEALNKALVNKKELNLNKLPNFKDVREKFLKIYEKDKIITLEYCYSLLEKRKTRKAKKKKEKK